MNLMVMITILKKMELVMIYSKVNGSIDENKLLHEKMREVKW